MYIQESNSTTTVTTIPCYQGWLEWQLCTEKLHTSQLQSASFSLLFLIFPFPGLFLVFYLFLSLTFFQETLTWEWETTSVAYSRQQITLFMFLPPYLNGNRQHYFTINPVSPYLPIHPKFYFLLPYDFKLHLNFHSYWKIARNKLARHIVCSWNLKITCSLVQNVMVLDAAFSTLVCYLAP